MVPPTAFLHDYFCALLQNTQLHLMSRNLNRAKKDFEISPRTLVHHVSLARVNGSLNPFAFSYIKNSLHDMMQCPLLTVHSASPCPSLRLSVASLTLVSWTGALPLCIGNEPSWQGRLRLKQGIPSSSHFASGCSDIFFFFPLNMKHSKSDTLLLLGSVQSIIKNAHS